MVAKIYVSLTRLASWQSGLSNSSVVGQLVGLFINGWTQDRFGCRPTMMFFLAWMCITIFGPVFATSLPLLAFGEAMCGVSWGVFQVSSTKNPWVRRLCAFADTATQTLSTAYASEVVPTVLRPYVTAYVCMCWGAGILFSSGVARAVLVIEGDWGELSVGRGWQELGTMIHIHLTTTFRG